MATLNPNFKLKKPKSTVETPILLKVYIDGERMTYSIRRSILPSYWDDEAGRAIKFNGKADRDLRDQLQEINTHIGKFIVEVKRLESYYNHHDIQPTIDRLKADLADKFGKPVQEKNKPLNLNEYIAQYIDDIENKRRLTDDKKPYTIGTIKNYRGFQAQFNEFQESVGRQYDFEDITERFYDDFSQYFIEKDYQVNTMGRHVKNLKTIMGKAFHELLHSNNEFFRFKVLKEEVVAIYLSLEELETLYNLDLEEDKDKLMVRDVFLIGAYSALRVSDYTRIKKEHVKVTQDGDKRIDIITQKTDERVVVPVWHWILEELLEKYDNEVPYVYPQKINKLMKKIGEQAGLDEPIEVEKREKGERVSNQIPKYKLIVTHTARRSAATNMYKHGIDTLDIMKITGHKTESAFMSYIRVTKDEAAERIMKHRIKKPIDK